MNPEKDQLTTAELARAAEDIRGHEDERMIGREAVAEPVHTTPTAGPAAPARRPQEAAAPPRDRAPLFTEHDAGDLRKKWSDVQAGFVDEPRRAVEQADSLVAEVMQRLAQGFADERSRLEQQWDRGDNVTTEDLRIALQRYRSFFDRLLSF